MARSLSWTNGQSLRRDRPRALEEQKTNGGEKFLRVRCQSVGVGCNDFLQGEL